MTATPDGYADPLLDIGSLGVAPVDDLAPEPPLPLGEITDLILTLDKAIRSQRLYQPNNPVYHSFITAAHTAFGNIWDRIGEVTVSVEESAFRWYGRAFPVGEGRDNLTFLFYKDGIRFITFLPGFEDELERFMQVVNRARSLEAASDDDMVTLLWQAELTSFQYSYIDALGEGLQIPQSTLPKLKTFDVALRDAALAGTDPNEVHSPAVAAGEPPVVGMINRDDFAETLYFLEPAELEQLKREVALEWSRDLRKDVLHALFDRLEDKDLDWRTEILRILRQLLPVHLGAGDLTSATRILRELTDILDRNVLEGEHREDAVALFRELSEPEVLTQLLRSLEDGVVDPEGDDLGIFLKHVGPPAMAVLLAAIERTELPALQQRLRRSMVELGTAHQVQLVALLQDGNNDVVRGAARLCGEIGIVGAAGPLAGLLGRNDPLLRRAAIESLGRIRTSVAMEALQRALTDDDRDVRVAAARGLAAVQYQPARPRLTELLDTKQVRDADLTEKLAFFEAFGSVATADNIPMLDRILNGRRLLAKETPEMRACAAMALGKIGTPASREVLQRAASETNPIVRNAVLKALRPEARV